MFADSVADASVVGIPYEKRYFHCLQCKLRFCNSCHGRHPSDHIPFCKRQVSRSTPHGPPLMDEDCVACMKTMHTGFQCKECDYRLCFDCFPDSDLLKDHQHKLLILIHPPSEYAVESVEPSCSTCETASTMIHCGRCLEGTHPCSIQPWKSILNSLQVSEKARRFTSASLASRNMSRLSSYATSACQLPPQSTRHLMFLHLFYIVLIEMSRNCISASNVSSAASVRGSFLEVKETCAELSRIRALRYSDHYQASTQVVRDGHGYTRDGIYGLSLVSYM